MHAPEQSDPYSPAAHCAHCSPAKPGLHAHAPFPRAHDDMVADPTASHAHGTSHDAEYVAPTHISHRAPENPALHVHVEAPLHAALPVASQLQGEHTVSAEPEHAEDA